MQYLDGRSDGSIGALRPLLTPKYQQYFQTVADLLVEVETLPQDPAHHLPAVFWQGFPLPESCLVPTHPAMPLHAETTSAWTRY